MVMDRQNVQSFILLVLFWHLTADNRGDLSTFIPILTLLMQQRRHADEEVARRMARVVDHQNMKLKKKRL